MTKNSVEGKQGQWLLYCLPLLITAVFVLLCYTGQVIFFIPLLVVMNLLNEAGGEFKEHELQHVLHRFNHCPLIKVVKYVSAFLFLIFNIWLLYFVSLSPRDVFSLVVLVLSAAIINCTFTMALGHELLHIRGRWSRPLANALLFTVCLPFFTNDHIFGHHRNVATPADKSSAPKNQSLYAYLREVIVFRVRRSFFNSVDRISLATSRENLALAGVNFLVAGVLIIMLDNSFQVFLFFAGQSVISYLMFEVSNYVQHYGLQRRRRQDGNYEPAGVIHSWNYYHRYTNYLTYLVPLHSYHHAHESENERLTYGPRLPYSYFRMMLLAMLPGRWFKKMNSLCEQYC